MSTRRAYFLFALLFCLIVPALSQSDIGNPEDLDAAIPVRLAYFSHVEGGVFWRVSDGENSQDPQTGWDGATVNLPLRGGMEVLTAPGARVEICFDDGSLLRLGSDSLLSIATLDADVQSEFTALNLERGKSTLRLKNPRSIFEVKISVGSVRSSGPSSIRLDSTNTTRIAILSGDALVKGEPGTLSLASGQSLVLFKDQRSFAVSSLNQPDEWDNWNLERDRFWSNPNENLPRNIALVAGDLDAHGSWEKDAQLGPIWYPRVDEVDWRPYHNGSWNWVYPWGWTWVSTEPWGWAPYHYGTWTRAARGWAWVPGPAGQPWSPAVVDFDEEDGNDVWSPLGPSEVLYPPVSPRSDDFSIGWTANYYPSDDNDQCEPYGWSTPYVNRVTNINYNTYVNEVYEKKIVVVRPRGDRRDWKHRRDGAPDDIFRRHHDNWNIHRNENRNSVSHSQERRRHKPAERGSTTVADRWFSFPKLDRHFPAKQQASSTIRPAKSVTTGALQRWRQQQAEQSKKKSNKQENVKHDHDPTSDNGRDHHNANDSSRPSWPITRKESEQKPQIDRKQMGVMQNEQSDLRKREDAFREELKRRFEDGQKSAKAAQQQKKNHDQATEDQRKREKAGRDESRKHQERKAQQDKRQREEQQANAEQRRSDEFRKRLEEKANKEREAAQRAQQEKRQREAQQAEQHRRDEAEREKSRKRAEEESQHSRESQRKSSENKNRESDDSKSEGSRGRGRHRR